MSYEFSIEKLFVICFMWYSGSNLYLVYLIEDSMEEELKPAYTLFGKTVFLMWNVVKNQSQKECC